MTHHTAFPLVMALAAAQSCVTVQDLNAQTAPPKNADRPDASGRRGTFPPGRSPNRLELARRCARCNSS
jgi:hypothetical protein